jgi:NACHT domain
VPAEQLLGLHLRPLIERSCPKQVPQHPSYNPDATLWLARNVAHTREPWAKTPIADEIERLTLAYQPTPTIGEVVARSRAQRCLAVVGEAGAGKSALAAALAWPEFAARIVPARFVQAIALFTEATTPQELARAVGDQLARAVPGFHEAQKEFARETPYAAQQTLGTLERQVVEPLKRLAPAPDVRLVLDGLDRLPTGARGSVMAALDELAGLDFVRLVITARPDTELPNAAAMFSLPQAPEEEVRQYLERRKVPEARRGEVANAARGSQTRSGCSAPITRRRSRSATTSPPGPATAATPRKRCGSFGRCSPTRSGCSAPATRIRSRPGTTSPSGPATAATPGKRCGSLRRCSPTWSGCSAPITPTRSGPATTSPIGPARAETQAWRCGSRRRSFPTWSGCAAPIIRRRSGSATTSPP